MSVNKVILLGRLGQDPELKYTPGGSAVCNFSMATTEAWTDKQGAKQEKTEWHNIVMYRRLAEIAGEYLKKGRPVYIEGRLQTRGWEDESGKKHFRTELVANEMILLGERHNAGHYAQDQHDDMNDDYAF